MSGLHVLSGGAAQGLAARLAADFKERTGLDIVGDFGAVGVMAERLRSGAPADLVILTAELVARLADEKLLVPSSIRDVGVVETALAVRRGDPILSVSNAAELRNAFLAADAIFIPDITNSTAGIHVAKVLRQLQIIDIVARRLRVYPNGAMAMRRLAASDAASPVGCTQSTEIISTSGVELSGALPAGYDLKTMYAAAVAAHATSPAQARALIELLTGAASREARRAAGFAS